MKEDANENTDGPPRPPRRRWWVWVPAGCFGFVAVMAILASIVIAGRARSRWKEFEPRQATLKARVQGRPTTRAPLEGEAEEGDAWAEYIVCAEALQKMTDKERGDVGEAQSAKGGEEVMKRACAALDAHEQDLEGFRKAAHLSASRPVIAWREGFNARLEFLATFRFAARAIALDSRRRRMAGDLEGALDDVTAMLQLGSDTSRSGPLICMLVGTVITNFALFAARDIAIEPGLTPAQSGRLEKLLERADAANPALAEVLDSEHLMLNETMLALVEGRVDLNELAEFRGIRVLAWREGFSYRIMAADTDAACTRLRDVAAKEELEPWPHARDAYDQLRASWEKSILLSMLMVSPEALGRPLRLVRARMRVLRAFLVEHRTGAPADPMPEDPFTIRPLHRREDPDRILIWSEGPDGDSGGTGKFDADSPDKGDIVLEWKR